ncbi:Aminomethyltransferase folate-binding domain-containing protein [Mollisia scopiformis]|uniref:Iron-sulfur cluster assembly factor IBA57 homolog, mitochondrial n=1 Tax=Mollisia scopiformis TaxID=149040 RepID=A0A194XP42_MOLSC|nr:Aminomethyltransferase folate-binding domain-containing protein [Mollisia scopiformis]KUJ21953.1 Aminomethyltransferase folate-binding domain-containing protein [Mollisia scopiformis]
MKPLRTILQPAAARPYICNNCLSRTLSRKYSTNPPKPPTKGYTLLPTRRLLSLSGPDATHFLQGAITANVSSSTSNPRLNTGFYAAFLNAQGRLLNDVFVFKDKREGVDGWLVEVDGQEVERLAKHVKRYRLRSKFEVKVLSQEEMGVWSVWDEEGGWTAHSLGGGGGEGTGEGREIGCEDLRAPGMGRRVVFPAGKRPDVEMEESDEEAYRIRRYLKGVPEGQDELIREHALPQESCADFMGGIDYRKGCYVGQELTIRTHHTGVVRKRVLPVMIYGKDETEPAWLEYDPEKDYGVEGIPRDTSIGRLEKRGRSAGKFLAGVGNIGLGLCRLETMTDVQVQGAAGGYKEGDEFKLEWEAEGSSEMVKVKAFVPSWHLKQ